MGTILEKLTAERFGGQEPAFRRARWGDVIVQMAQDDKNWYYIHRGANSLYAQAKQGDKTPYCVGCNSKLMFKEQSASQWDHPSPEACAGGGEVRLMSVPYCPNCEEEPKGSTIEIKF